ncbi:hypothetical protein KUCAC02_013657 [Chaenocephalus aceratus]|uniref:Uncharacterized protein n=1 Tax=Chaenocephalus aceratus TaxID=36190 RepID=A0ACB9WC52_CHAAC|nr:hypothetical protein KUCAC02_013657 [Chaenocephalus aceratus]
MVEQFVGTWALLSSENFDEYMKAIGVGFATRQMGNMAKPNLTTEIKFKLNEEFDETTADGRKTKTLITCANGKLVQQQTWEDKTTTLEREIQEGKLTAKCVMDDVVAVRIYEKGA